MHKKLRVGVAIGAFLLATVSLRQVSADSHGIRHVLLISVDGLHALDYLNCSNGIPGFNGGDPYCPNLAALGTTGVNYLDTSTSRPSDSFPGLMALVTGGSPRTMGVNYDVAYDRALNPPQNDTGNGMLGGGCTPGATPSGTSTEFDEGININVPGIGGQMFLNGGAPSGDGGVNSIDPTRLDRDQNCNPCIRGTSSASIRFSELYTAREVIRPGLTSIRRIRPWAVLPVPALTLMSMTTSRRKSTPIPRILRPERIPSLNTCKPNLPDQFAVSAGDDYTGSFLNIQCYDSLKVQAILNEIDGRDHDGTAKAPVPNIFGMNFQAVSIGQKLIYQHNGAVPPMSPTYSTKGGYLDSIGTPSASLLQEIKFVDNSIGLMVNELKKQHLYRFDADHHHRKAWPVAGRYQPLRQERVSQRSSLAPGRLLPDSEATRSDRPRMT